MSNDDKTIRVGSRKSQLALIQTKHVIALLQNLYRNKNFEIHTMSTMGDRVLNVSLPKIGEKSLFTRDLEDALRNGGVDFVVHSLKDLPTALPTGMAIGAVLKREDARDALVLRETWKHHTLQTLPEGCVIGTSSLRRTAQLRRQYPHLTICDIRGNLNTRLAKLDAPDSKFSGIILAQAGLERMGWNKRISQVLEPTDLLYAVGQGALAVECRANDTEILDMLRSLNCLPTTCRILAERSFLKTLGGGCSAPVAVVSKLHGAQLDYENNNPDETSLALEGAVWSLNGATEIRDQLCCSLVVGKCKKPMTDKESEKDNNVEDENVNVEEPPEKRMRQTANMSSIKNSLQRHSPPIINDDPAAVSAVENITKPELLKEFISKHIDLAKKCPIIGNKAQTTEDNGNMSIHHGGGGDADYNAATTTSNLHCPLHIHIGQDVMGECPMPENIKLSFANICKCTKPEHNTDNKSNVNEIVCNNEGCDQVDRAVPPPTTTNCSTATVTANKPVEYIQMLATGDGTNMTNLGNPALLKCPFAQLTKTKQSINSAGDQSEANVSGKPIQCPYLKVIEYGDKEKPLPKNINILIEDIDDLFCGLYQHKCFSRELYVKANELGQQLAHNLIKKGALDVMHVAQAEIHSKIS